MLVCYLNLWNSEREWVYPPNDPCHQKEERNALGAFLLEVGQDLRHLSYSPTDHAHESKGKWHFVSLAADTVLEVNLYPFQTILLHWAILINWSLHCFSLDLGPPLFGSLKSFQCCSSACEDCTTLSQRKVLSDPLVATEDADEVGQHLRRMLEAMQTVTVSGWICWECRDPVCCNPHNLNALSSSFLTTCSWNNVRMRPPANENDQKPFASDNLNSAPCALLDYSLQSFGGKFVHNYTCTRTQIELSSKPF